MHVKRIAYIDHDTRRDLATITVRRNKNFAAIPNIGDTVYWPNGTVQTVIARVFDMELSIIRVYVHTA